MGGGGIEFQGTQYNILGGRKAQRTVITGESCDQGHVKAGLQHQLL